MVVPWGQPASSTWPGTPPSTVRDAPRGASAVQVSTSMRDTAHMAARASPRKPRVPMASRSRAEWSLLVAWRRKAVFSCPAGMPLPSSVTRRKVMPPWAISTVTMEAPASTAFSISSLAALAGRSTTSPAAIKSATCGSNTAISGMMYPFSYTWGSTPRTWSRAADSCRRLCREARRWGPTATPARRSGVLVQMVRVHTPRVMVCWRRKAD